MSLFLRTRLAASSVSKSFGNRFIASLDREPVAPVTGNSAEDNEAIVARAVSNFSSHPLAFTNIDVKDISFEPVEDSFRGGSSKLPQLMYKGENSKGLYHLTPWCRVFFSHAGTMGNIGSSKWGGDKVEPHEGKLQLAISDKTALGSGSNFIDYVAWISEIEEKYIDHICENTEHYPSVAKKFKTSLNKPELLKELLRSSNFSFVKESKNEYEAKYIVFNRKLYYPNDKKTPNHFERLEDKEVFEKYGLVRRPLPLFNQQGEAMEQKTRMLYRDDVVSIGANLRPVLTEIGQGFKLYLKNATCLTSMRPEFVPKEKAGSPFGAI